MSDQLIADLRQALVDLAEQYKLLHESRATIMGSLEQCVFVVETIAHLQGKERELLPMADRARALLDSAINK